MITMRLLNIYPRTHNQLKRYICSNFNYNYYSTSASVYSKRVHERYNDLHDKLNENLPSNSCSTKDQFSFLWKSDSFKNESKRNHDTSPYINTRRSILTPATKANTFRGIEEFFDRTRLPTEPVQVGREWTADELRRKSFSDLHKLWYVLYKERNLLLTEKQLCRRGNAKMQAPHRMAMVKKSMARILLVLRERSLEEGKNVSDSEILENLDNIKEEINQK